MYKKLMHREYIVETPSTGEFSTNTIRLEGVCRQIVIEPVTSTTAYEFQIIDDRDIVIFETDTETGNYPELTTLPMYGIYTVKIFNATVDEEFKLQLILEV